MNEMRKEVAFKVMIKLGLTCLVMLCIVQAVQAKSMGKRGHRFEGRIRETDPDYAEKFIEHINRHQLHDDDDENRILER
jgi:hypothetical protein